MFSVEFIALEELFSLLNVKHVAMNHFEQNTANESFLLIFSLSFH